MNNPFEPTFEGFSRLYQKFSCPDITGTAIEHLLKNDPKVWGVGKHDARIRTLLDGNFDMEDAGGSFFKKNQTWREWDKGVSEVGVLSLWANSGVLATTVFPDASKGATSAFDAGLKIGGLSFGADIKLATTAASGLLLDRFEPKVATWAKANGIDVPELELHINGLVDLRRLKPKWAELERQFEEGIASQTNGEVSLKLECPLPGDPNDPQSASELEILVKLLPVGAAPTHSWSRQSLYQDKGGHVREPSVEFAQSLITEHAQKKSRYVDSQGKPLPFILAYYQGKFGDMRVEHVSAAMQRLHGPPNFYGVVFVDDMVSPPVRSFFPHLQGHFLPGLEPAVLEAELQR